MNPKLNNNNNKKFIQFAITNTYTNKYNIWRFYTFIERLTKFLNRNQLTSNREFTFKKNPSVLFDINLENIQLFKLIILKFNKDEEMWVEKIGFV